MMLSVVIITKNSVSRIEECLKSIKELAEEILVIDGGSIDGTLEIAKKYRARIVRQMGGGYSDWRNQGLKESRSDWIFYIDDDERATPELLGEIKETISNPQYNYYAIPRRNIILGKEMRHGGWWPDYVKRIYKKSALKKWVGDLHEEPLVEGGIGHLKNPVIHLKHNSLSEMVEKTNKWSEIEARLLLDAGHPIMSWWRFLRIIHTEIWYRLISKRGFLDGVKGIIYTTYQAWSRFITYSKLWEMQQGAKRNKHASSNI